MGKKSTARAAAVAQFVASAVENEAYKAATPRGAPHTSLEDDPPLQVEDAHWRGVFAGAAPEKTNFRVRVFYSKNPSGDDQGRVFEVTVREVKS